MHFYLPTPYAWTQDLRTHARMAYYPYPMLYISQVASISSQLNFTFESNQVASQVQLFQPKGMYSCRAPSGAHPSTTPSPGILIRQVCKVGQVRSYIHDDEMLCYTQQQDLTSTWTENDDTCRIPLSLPPTHGWERKGVGGSLQDLASEYRGNNNFLRISTFSKQSSMGSTTPGIRELYSMGDEMTSSKRMDGWKSFRMPSLFLKGARSHLLI